MIPQATSERRGPWFWAGVVIGWACILAGVRGVLVDDGLTRPGNLAKWVIGALVLHDVVFAPLVFVAAAGIGRITGRSATIVRAAVAATVLLTLFSWPLVRRYGERSANPTLLPLDYTRNLIVSLVVIWALAIAAVVWRRTRSGAGSEAA